MRGLIAAIAACAALNAAFMRAHPPRPRDPLGLRLEAESAVETAALLSLGMRRLAADLGLIRMLVYYGTSESHEEEEHAHAFDPEHPEKFWGGGVYPELGTRAKRILDVDPSFSYAALYAAGALAFNLDRPQEALEVLQYGLARDPRNFQYHAYIAAVGFHRHGDTRSVVRILEPMLASPDCPTMIKSMTAFLYVKMGRREKAARLYRDILETSRDPGYRSIAEKMLKGLKF